MALDRRIPAVYVDIEDRSYVAETGDTGRVGYVVILSDQGPHNRMVELNSREDLYDLFGRPDFAKYGQGHYLADAHLTTSSKLYVCRPTMMEPIGDATYDDCMAISNASIKTNDMESVVYGEYNFTENSNIVTIDSTSLLDGSTLPITSDTFTVGEWIYPEGEDKQYTCQIIDINYDDNELILDAKYNGPNVTSNIVKFDMFRLDSIKNMRSDKNANPLDPDILWHFIATGAGDPYNKYFIRGARNNQFEKIYMDQDANPLFPYAFMDIAIYRQNEDNTTTLMEGPWTVSLINKTATGAMIKDIYTGQDLYLPTVINRYSRLIKVIEGLGSSSLITIGENITYPYEPDNRKRLMVQSLLSEGNILGLGTIGDGGVFLRNGNNGNLFDEIGNLRLSSEYQALVAQAYNGSLTSVDGSIELILQEIYPWYVFDYILCGGYNNMINFAAKTLVDTRGDCLLLTDTGRFTNSAEEDLEIRRMEMSWNTWNAAIYTQYRELDDIHTGKSIWLTPVYHAILRHLWTDNLYWIAEPVAGIEKGAIENAKDLAYKPNITKLGDLMDAEMNPIIVEPDGTYILTQFTTWKRLSVMKRQHVVKFVHYCKKNLPTILKDILQRKATQYWINQAKLRVNGFMERFLDKGDSDRYAAINSYDAQVKFDDVRSELFITLTIHPIRAIERITVNIIVT